MAPQLGAPSGEAGYEDGTGDDALPPVSGRESTTKQWRSATACVVTCIELTQSDMIVDLEAWRTRRKSCSP